MTEQEQQIVQGIEGDMEQFELMCREWKECARTQVRYLLSTAREQTQAFNDGFAAGVTCVHAAVLDRQYFIQHLPPDMSRPDLDDFASPQPEDWHGPSELPRLSRETMEREMRKNIEKCNGWVAELNNVRQTLHEALGRCPHLTTLTQDETTTWLKVDRAHSQLVRVLKEMGVGNDFATPDESTTEGADQDEPTDGD